MRTLFNKALDIFCRLFNINRWYMKNINGDYCWWRMNGFEWERIGWEDEY